MLFPKESMIFPKLTKIRQNFPVRALKNIEAEIIKELDRVHIQGLMKKRKKIAIAVGSRGVSNIALVVKTVVGKVKSYGGDPFITPAMGSQGGGTPEGKIEVLKGLGVTEDYVKAPILSSMDVIHLGYIEDGCPVYVDRMAAEADGVIAINRVKPHTHAKGGPNESGIVKMLSIGLGNLRGCQSLHAYGFPRLSHRISQAAKLIIEKTPIMLGIATVEDAYDHTALIEAVKPETFLERDHALLEMAYANMPSLPSDDFDVLVVKWVGKDISGPAMDPNITGRGEIRALQNLFTKPAIRRVVALNLTNGACGNAAGVAAADYITQKLLKSIDVHDTNVNCIASAFPEVAKIPPAMDDDQEAIYAALMTYGRPDPLGAKLMVISSTLHLEHLYVSSALMEEVSRKDHVEIISRDEEFEFDSEGNLLKQFPQEPGQPCRLPRTWDRIE
jgi:hypothetical protein